jgi:uncharacterized Zn finger protein
MSVIICERCGERFDTDREPVTPAQNTLRCSGCGHDHSEETTEVPDTEPVASTGERGMPKSLPVEELADRDGDVHMHVHYHGD